MTYFDSEEGLVDSGASQRLLVGLFRSVEAQRCAKRSIIDI
jgi:hypothetical protein